MTIDEAIKHAEEVMIENLEKTKGRNASDPIAINCFECADEHRQLAEWLKELKQLREQTTWIPVSERLPEDGIPCICTVYNTDIYRDNIQVYDNYLVYDEYTEQWIDDDMELCTYDVLAWIPSPKPYEPQEGE